MERGVRMLLTSYNKSGTHQAMQMFLHNIQHVIDYSARGMGNPGNRAGIDKTVSWMETFDGKKFGHITCLPEYVDALQKQPTRVLFNVRDPRDIVVSEFLSNEGRVPGHIRDIRKQSKDPITDLIKLSARRWPNWLGWLDYPELAMVVKYEDLRLKPKPTVSAIAKFIGGPLGSVDAMIGNAQNTKVSATFRKGIVGEWRSVFKDRHVELANKLLAPTMESLGYEA